MNIKPNVLLISVDTLRFDHISCYGYRKKTTPNIDRIASEGTIFRENFSTAIWTPPAHASMFTGLYVSEHGVYGENRLNDNIPTISTVLQENGYQTAGFVNNSQVGELVGLAKGHETFNEIWKGISKRSIIKRGINGSIQIVKKWLGYDDMGANKTNNLFKNWIKKKRDHQRPFYTFIHYIEPHNPLNPPRKYKKKHTKKSMLSNINLNKIKKVADNPLICLVKNIELNEQEIDWLKSLYDAEIEYTDAKIGEILNILKTARLYDNTLIIITSDHGEHFGEHGLWSHAASMYNEVLRTPLIIKYPKGLKYKRDENGCTQVVDIFPTVMEIAGISNIMIKKSSGNSLAYNNNKDINFHNYIFAEWEGRVPYFIKNNHNYFNNKKSIRRLKNKMWMVSDGRFKLIIKSDGGEELYDLKNDNKESYNFINENPSIAKTLKIILKKKKLTIHKKIKKRQLKIDEETKKNLESLGYM
jgi:arylsulfatase A-like enzyme